MIKYILERAPWLNGIINRYLVTLFLYVLIGFSAGAVVFLSIIRSPYGILPPNLFFATMESDKRLPKTIALLDSDYSALAYKKMMGNHRAQVDLWATLLKAAGATPHMLKDADLEHGINGKFEALVLPGSIALSETERNAVRSFVRSGGGLLVEGPAGTWDRDERWRGWDFLKELASVDAIETLKKENSDPRFVTLTGGSPLSVNLPPGLKIKNNSYSDNYSAPSDKSEAYWSEWLQPLSKLGPRLSAVKTNRYGKGRIAWFGFNLGSMSDEPEQRAAVIRLIDNATDWIVERPTAQVATWPHGEQAAVNLTFDCENNFENLSHVLDLPDSEPFRFTFFMLSSVAEQHKGLVKRAAGRGEIAIHGDDHTVFKGQTYDMQLRRLAHARSVLEKSTNRHVVSFRPPEQQFDDNTLAALGKLGMSNLFSDYLGDSSPHMATSVRFRGGLSVLSNRVASIIKIPRPTYDDYDLYVRDQLNANQAAELFLDDLHRVIKEGGLYALSMHTTAPWGGLNADKLPALIALLREVRGSRVWVATVQEAADWWEKRSSIKVNVRRYSDAIILLHVTNLNNESVTDLPIDVYLPNDYSNVQVQSSKVEFQTPKWELKESGKLTVRIQSIKAGESKSYVITNGKATS